MGGAYEDWNELESILAEGEKEGSVLSQEDFYELEEILKLDWNEKLKIPEKRRRSGKLGAPDKAPAPIEMDEDEDEDDDERNEVVSCLVPQWKFGGLLPKEAREVYRKTMEFQNDKVRVFREGIAIARSLQIAVDQTMAALKMYAREAGGQIIILRKVRQSCKIKCIKWNCSTKISDQELVDLFPQDAFVSPKVLQDRARKALEG